MSRTTDGPSGSPSSEDEELLPTGETPHITILDETKFAGGLQDHLEQTSWDYTIAEGPEGSLAYGGEGCDCLVVDPSMVRDPVGFVRELRERSDTPVILWGNDIDSSEVRRLANISGTDYVPKPVQGDGRVFCVSSLSQPFDASPVGNSAPDVADSDEIIVSMVKHAVREYRMAERVEMQLDAMENSLSGIAILDEDSEIIYANQTLVDILAYDSVDILVGNSSQMCFPHHEIDRFQNEILPTAQSSGQWRGGIDCRRMDGSIFPARLAVSPIEGERSIVTVEDISEQQVLQEELEEFHEHIGQGYVAVNDDLLISQVNEAAKEIFDLPEQGCLTGEPLFDFHFGEIEEGLRDGFADVDTTDEETSISLRLDSLEKWVEIRIYPFDRGYALYFRDITETKERQRRLRFAENFLECSSDAYLVIEADSGEVVDVNSTACKWLGVGEADLIGMNVVEMANKFSDIDDYTMEDHLEFCREARDGVAIREAQYGPPAGSMYPIEAYGSCEVVNGTEYLVVTALNSEDRGPETAGGVHDVARSFLETCPAPALLLDPETDEVIDLNCPLLKFTGFSREGAVGSNFLRFFPDHRADTQADECAQLLESGGGFLRRCRDGSYMKIETSSGETIPIELTLGTVDLVDDIAHICVLRSIEDDVRQQTSFEKVNEMTRDLIEADGPSDIVETATRAVEEMPVFKGSVAYLYDDSEGVLEAAAYNESVDGAIEEIRTFEPGDGYIWDVYSESEPHVSPDADWLCPYSKGEIAVPIGTHGVLFMCSSDTISEEGVISDLANIIASSIESALNRSESVSELRKSKRDANLQRQQLEYVSDLNERIRSLNEALVQAESKEAIKKEVCEALIHLDDFDGILFGDVNSSESQVEPAQSIRMPEEFLDQIPISPSEEGLSPTAQAAENQAPVEIANIPSRAQQEEWAAVALEYDYKSAISIPLTHGGISYGILTIYSDLTEAFDGRTKSVLKELGSLVAYACHAVTSRTALGSDTGIDLSFTVDATGALPQLAEELSSSLTVQNVTPANDGQHYLAHGHIEDCDPDVVVGSVESMRAFDDLRMIGEPDSGIYELKIEEPGSIAKIVDLGVSFQSAVVAPESTEVTVTLPADRDRGQFIDQVKNHLPDLKLRASHEEVNMDTIPWSRLLRESLTEKQETALRTAYYVGYFDSPAETNGRELADRLGLSQGTISYRLRAAQRNLYEILWGSQEQPVGREIVEH